MFDGSADEMLAKADVIDGEADTLNGDSITERNRLEDRFGNSELIGSSVDEALPPKKEDGKVKDSDGLKVDVAAGTEVSSGTMLEGKANGSEELKVALGGTEAEAGVTKAELEIPATELVELC